MREGRPSAEEGACEVSVGCVGEQIVLQVFVMKPTFRLRYSLGNLA